MASFDVFDSFFIIKISQEWGRTWYNPWQSKIEAKLHEESKFWRASKPFPNQSSVQGRKLKKESNTEEFRNHLRNFCKTEGNFATIFYHLRNFLHLLFSIAKFSHLLFSIAKILHLLFLLINFRSSISQLRNLHVIFRYFYTDFVRFLPQYILCNYLFSPSN